MKSKKWLNLYESDILRNGGYEEYYFKKIKYRKKFIKKIKQYAIPRKKVLEAGCGTGVISINLASSKFSSYAVDYDLGMLDIVKKIALSIKNKVPNLMKEDIFEVHKNFCEDEFDVVYSIGVYEHYDDKKIIQLLKSQLKISKYVFVGIPTKYFNEDEKLYGNERFLNLNYWRRLFTSDEYEIIEEFSCNNSNFFHRVINYKKWFRPAPIHVFVIRKLSKIEK